MTQDATAPRQATPSANMAYTPHSKPAFPGDIQHDLRDYQQSRRLTTLADWMGAAAETYLRAARILRCESTDPMAIVLQEDDRFDARTLWVVHDHMAAHWRAEHMHEAMHGPEILTGPEDHVVYCRSYAGLQFRFQRWLRHVVSVWADRRPDVLHLFLRTTLAEHTRTGQQLEARLFQALATLHPVPGRTVPAPLQNTPP